MCGIFGIFDPSGNRKAHTRLGAMGAALAHRGPDGEHHFSDSYVALGHRRLAIRDLSEKGRQPMADETGRFVSTFNGEIYNYHELRGRLEREFGVTFQSHCDAELFPHGVKYLGPAFFEMLEGMFAAAVWDAEKKRLFLVRDRLGVKPLFYFQGEVIVFASELKGVVASGTHSRELSKERFWSYIHLGHVGHSSMLSGVGQVLPGSIQVFEHDGTMSSRKYWFPKRTSEIRSEPEALEEFGKLWPRVVERTLISDVPIGVMQSGGIDSSLVSLELRKQQRDVPLFFADFRSHAHSERKLVNQIARHGNMTIHSIQVDQSQGAAESFQKMVRGFDGQVADSSGLAFLKISGEISRTHKVVLSGDGADEFFGGYETYKATRIAELGPIGIFSPVLRAIAIRIGLCISEDARISRREKLKRLLNGFGSSNLGGMHARWRTVTFPEHVARLFPGPASWRESDPFAEYIDAFNAAPGGGIERGLFADQVYYLPGDLLKKSDAMSMAYGLEVRVPFLDPLIVDFSLRLHPELLFGLAKPTKPLLRAALSRYGVDRNFTTAKKRGFNVPVANMLRNELIGLCDSHLDGDLDVFAGLADPRGVRDLWREHRHGTRDHGYLLWSLLSFSVWRKSL